MANAYGAQQYRQQTVNGASPIRLIVMTYDVAIQACEQRDLERSTRAVSLLRDSLNFEAGDAAVGLFRLYQWCLENIRGDNYPEAIKTLRSLRDAWRSAEVRMNAPAEIPAPAKLQPATLAIS